MAAGLNHAIDLELDDEVPSCSREGGWVDAGKAACCTALETSGIALPKCGEWREPLEDDRYDEIGIQPNSNVWRIAQKDLPSWCGDRSVGYADPMATRNWLQVTRNPRVDGRSTSPYKRP